VLCEDDVIRPEHLPVGIVHAGLTHRRGTCDPTQSLAEVEREHILAVLAACGGNKARAAAALGISSTTLWRKLKEMESREGGRS